MTHKKLSTKILSFVLSAAMLFSIIPTTVFATEGEPDQPPAQSEQTTPPETPEAPPIESETPETPLIEPETPEQSAYEQVVALFTALPNALVITAETTEEEKDVIFAQLTAAMDAFDVLTQEEQDKFLAEQEVLYKAAKALNDAITGAKAEVLAISTWGELQAALTAGGTVVLTRDITATPTDVALIIPTGITVNLNLAGFTINRKLFSSESGGNVITVNGTLTLEDTVGTGKITGGYSSSATSGVNVASDGKFTMESGTISGNKGESKGGGVGVDGNGTFTMNGGTISGNEAKLCGGVNVASSGNFIMNGGKITMNSGLSSGGVTVVGKCTMNGGEISDNMANHYGGVNVAMQGTFTMNGGEIRRNRALVANSFATGGVNVYNNTTFILGGNAVIKDNVAAIADSGQAANNVNFDSGGFIKYNTDKPLGAGAEIGVTKGGTVGPFTDENAGWETYIDKFFSDNNSHKVKYNTTTQKLELYEVSTISFDARNGQTIAPVTVGDDGEITLPAAPTWDYTFGGWYTGIDGAGDVVTADTVHTASATVYAKWTKGIRTVYTQPLDLYDVRTDKSGDGYVWDYGNLTLTLSGVNIVNVEAPISTFDSEGDQILISYGLNLPRGAKVSLAVGSENNIAGANIKPAHFLNGFDRYKSFGIFSESGTLTINGSGTLNVTSGSVNVPGKKASSCGMDVKDLIVDGDAKINVVGDDTIAAYEAFCAGISANTLTMNGGAINTTSTGVDSDGIVVVNGITMTAGTLTAKGLTDAIRIHVNGITATGATVDSIGSTTTVLIQKDPAIPVVISFGPSIKVDAQTGAATYGTAINTTFAVTASSFGGKYPDFDPTVEWVGTAPTGVIPTFNGATLTMPTTAATHAGEYKFKVVSAKTGDGNYESAEATLKVDQLGATIEWGSIVSFQYNGTAQAPTATVSNKVGSDVVTVAVTGAETDVGTGYTATADALAGAAAVNYAMPSTKPTTTFTITKAAYTGTQATPPSASGAAITDTTITLPQQTIGETVEYGYSSTADGDITWQDSNVFNGLTSETDYYFFARVKANDNHDAGTTSKGTKIKTDKSDAKKVAEAKAKVETALEKFTATNATDADAMLALANKALTDAGITGITVAWDTAFSKTDATESADGSITGKIKLTCDTATDTVDIARTITMLPSDPTEKINLVKKAIETALSNFKATNATTDVEIKAIVDKANADSGVKTVTIAWGTPAFSNSNSTDSKDGAVTGTFNLSCTSGGSSATDTISINCPIERSDKQKLAGAIIDADNAKTGITINNGSPSSVAKGTKFVSDAEMKALTDAIAAAQLVLDNTAATSADLIAATTTLNDAIATFKTAIKTGTYTSGGGTPPSPPSYGGGGSGGDSTPPAVEPPTTTQNPPTTIETNIPATVDKNGNATVNVTDKIMQDAIDKAVIEANKNGTIANGVSIVINVTTGGKDANTVTVNLPKTVQETVIAGQVVNTIVVVDRPDIAINMNLASIKEINKQAQADVQLSATRLDNSKLSAQAQAAVGNRPAFDLKASYESGTKAVSNFGTGSVTVEIPYTIQKGEVAGNLYAVYVDEYGKVSYITNSSYDANAKVLRFATNHFSVYGIGSKTPTGFTDIADHWAKDDIEFVANRGLLSGTSNTAFSPNSAMTRGMFAKALTTLSGKDMTAVVGGNMADMVTREGMAVIMQNYAKAISYTLPSVHVENIFADSAKISTSANDSVKKLQMAGVISGKSGNVFDPQGTSTRAEVSAVLRRFIELAISTDTAQGWMMNDSGKWMYYENGKAVKSGTKSIDGKSYTFNGYGETVDVPKNLNYGNYVVKKGESWWKIAHDQKCNMLELAKLNGKTIFSMIHPGDTLKIPQK